MNKSYAILILPFFLCACWEIGTGEKVGTIVKLNNEGFFCKTNEAQLIRGGMNNASGSFGQPFNFTIEDEALLQKVKDALDNQSEVKIKYHQEFVTFCRNEPYKNPNDGSNYFLDSIEVMK